MAYKKKLGAVIVLLSFISCNALEIPSFLDEKDIKNAEFKCLTKPVKYSKKDQKYVDILWDETLTYIKAYALALTNGEVSECLNSDEAVYDTTQKKRICVMDRRDMKTMVKNIYQILENPDKAKECFSARRDVNWIYNPGGELNRKISSC